MMGEKLEAIHKAGRRKATGQGGPPGMNKEMKDSEKIGFEN